MGVMSRRVLPVCGNLCFFCPSLRARSRQPVKRYKKFLADIFPRNQEAEPNDRKIGKLCDYASKNPLRIPKITDTLEQRFYKELRHGNFGSVKVVVCIYRKLLSSCKEQMPLFASSLLGIVRTLMEQTGQDEMQILACNILVDFINSQTDSTQMFNLEGIIPKLCQLAQGVGDGERTLRLHSAGLQALASMVSFTGEHSHISMEFDNIISVTLENYIDPQMNPDIINKVSLPSLTTKPELDHTMDTSKSPSYWSRVCLCNMARLAKEATTFRRVLEPLFRNFDTNNHWPLEKGVAYPVLIYLQSLLEEAGDNSHLLLSNLVKHLDHKNVFKEPLVQIDIVNVISQLGQNAKQEVTVTVIDAISDLIKHLRKCLQNAAELSSSGDCIDKQNADLQFAIEKCILQLSNKTSNHMALARCFQLAFSLRGISLDQERGLQPSRRRSLFTLASYMLIFSAKAGNFPELIPIVKASLTEKTADPYLESVEDIRLQTVYLESDGGKMVYGSEEDNVAASQSLSAIKLDDHHLKETLISQFIKKFAKLTEVELSRIKELLLQEFLPDDVYPLGAPLFMETPRPCSSLAQVEVQAFEEIMPAASLTDDETITAANANENLSGRKTSLSVNSLDILSVNELLESVLETAQEVASSQISSTPIPYDQMKSQCEALVTGKQQKMSMLQSLKHQHDAKVFPTRDEKKGTSSFNQKVELLQSDSKLNSNDQNGVPDQLALCSVEYGHTAFRLPPSSPYDKFMKAAGC
ncbi:protein SEMI-ROLLED LEAF 2 isoform X5 [Hevea brasiliensis]|uniref:protein SEMI-ROLLED LEAF 2 isoform X5 n=1 Tax=Hevea brasiliensis TaxID=3981 RepID=UPI0025E4A3DF|nr:protein SEMI-ROLLED LEAF 2 isoform X5 [Hevea brasiliensis]